MAVQKTMLIFNVSFFSSDVSIINFEYCDILYMTAFSKIQFLNYWNRASFIVT